MNTLVVASALNRKQGDAGAVARRAAEIVRNDQYVSCSNFTPSDTYPNLPTDPAQLPENDGLGSPRRAPVHHGGTTFEWHAALDGRGRVDPVNCAANPTAIQSVQIEVDSLPSPGPKATIYVVKSQP